MITPTVKTGQPHIVTTKVGGNKFIFEYQVSSSQYQDARNEIQETRLYLQLDFFAAWRLCERNQGIPPALFSRDCPDAYREGVAQFRLGALSADRQALREKRKRFSPAAGRYFVPRTYKFIFG